MILGMRNDGANMVVPSVHHLLLALLTFAAFGCGEEPPPPPSPTVDFPVTVTVKTETDIGVPKVPVLFGDKLVGYTDADGEFRASLRRQAGSELELSVGEASGFRYVSETSVKESLKSNNVGGSMTGVPLLLNVTAQSQRNDYFFWVRAKCDSKLDSEMCGGREIKIDGEVVATTNDLGYAQFTIAEVPETEVKVEIDTPDYDAEERGAVGMEPKDPTYTVALDLEPQIYHIEEEFTDALAKRRVYRAPRRSTSRRGSSSRKSTSKPKKEEKPKNDGVIDLF